jgi:simple sugar transport system substrate-binding protein
MNRNAVGRLGLCTMLGLLACSKDQDGDQQSQARTAAGDAAGEKPAPFDAGPVKIALVQNSGAGDYFEQWTDGVRKQADAAGFAVQIYDAKADPGQQASDMKAAIESGVKGIMAWPAPCAP